MHDPLTSADIYEPFKRHLLRETLKYAAGTAIFCPLCKNIMDFRRTTLVSVSIDGKLATCKPFCFDCCPCVQSKALDALASVAKHLGAGQLVTVTLEAIHNTVTEQTTTADQTAVFPEV